MWCSYGRRGFHCSRKKTYITWYQDLSKSVIWIYKILFVWVSEKLKVGSFVNLFFYNLVNEKLLFYSICCRCICFSSFEALPVFLVSCSILAFYVEIPDFYSEILCCLGFYVRYRAWCAAVGCEKWQVQVKG